MGFAIEKDPVVLTTPQACSEARKHSSNMRPDADKFKEKKNEVLRCRVVFK